MYDLSSVLGTGEAAGAAAVRNSTNKKAGEDMQMDDFLQLMVAMFQNQSIDDTADTSEMMNQMVQMSVIQAVTNLNNLVSQSTTLTYAASLVGKEVTIGQYVGRELKEIRGTVTGTGTLNGEQVIFLDDDQSYYLTDIMAVGRLPDLDKVEPAAEGGKAAGSETEELAEEQLAAEKMSAGASEETETGPDETTYEEAVEEILEES